MLRNHHRINRRADAELTVLEQAVAAGVGARAQWLAPLADELQRLIAIVNNQKFTDADVLRLVEAGRARLPELFAELDPAAFSAQLTAALGAAARAGLQDSLA
jgi:hypothetical protein